MFILCRHAFNLIYRVHLISFYILYFRVLKRNRFHNLMGFTINLNYYDLLLLYHHLSLKRTVIRRGVRRKERDLCAPTQASAFTRAWRTAADSRPHGRDICKHTCAPTCPNTLPHDPTRGNARSSAQRTVATTRLYRRDN